MVSWTSNLLIPSKGSLSCENKIGNGLVPGFFLARMTSWAITTAFEEEIIHLKNLCTHIDIVVEKLRLRPLFLKCGIAVRLWAINGRWSSLICTCTLYCNIRIGVLIRMGALIRKGALYIGRRALNWIITDSNSRFYSSELE